MSAQLGALAYFGALSPAGSRAGDKRSKRNNRNSLTQISVISFAIRGKSGKIGEKGVGKCVLWAFDTL